MSTDAISKVIQELEQLPDSDQALVLEFLRTMRRQPHSSRAVPARRGRNSAVQLRGGVLMFTGQVDLGDVDWLQLVRSEREAELAEFQPRDAPAR